MALKLIVIHRAQSIWLAGLLSLCLGLAACQQEKPADTVSQNDIAVSIDQNKAQEKDQESTNRNNGQNNGHGLKEKPATQTSPSIEQTLNEGFYGNDADLGDHLDEHTDERIGELGTLADSSEVKAPESNDLNDTQTDLGADQLIESMGFADAQTEAIDILPNAGKKKNHKPLCNSFSDPSATTPEPSSEITPKREAFCSKISKRLASVSSDLCMAAKLVPSGCNSVENVPLMLREFPPIEGKTPLGKVLVIGGTHGDELTSVSVTFRWIEKLNKFHSGLFHWHIIPSMNPDGLLPRSAQRTNHNGVDLNRNMPSDDWEQNAIEYWETKGGKNPRKFPGDKPNSEPETQWLVDEIALFKPDAIISVHAPYGVVDFDALQLNTAPKSLGKLHLNLLGTYPGSLGNYAGINRNIPVITLELPHSWEMPSHKESDLIWQDIVSWLKKNFEARKAIENVSSNN